MAKNTLVELPYTLVCVLFQGVFRGLPQTLFKNMIRGILKGISLSIFLCSSLLLVYNAHAGDTPINQDCKAYIIWPKDGAVIPGGKLWVRMGLRNCGVAPAGIDLPNTGHHHLIVDAELPPFDEDIPSDRHHFHMGKGQTEYRLELEPGTHTLQMLLADHSHIPHNPPVFSKRITITVPN